MTCLVAGLAGPLSGEGIIPFVPERWDLAGAKVVDHLDRRALMGTAILKDVEFENGTIECDIAMKAAARSYPGVLFRHRSDGEHERIYLRPHRSPLYGDAVQYVASFHGVDSWQLYNGPGLTAAAVIPTDRWVHMKIEVLGTQARVFLDHAPQPVLVIGDLKHGRASGRLGLTTVADGTAFFSNFSFRADGPLSFPPAPLAHRPPGHVKDWEISSPLKRRLLDPDRYPDLEALGVVSWTKAAAGTDGVLDISRTHGRKGAEPDAVLVRTSLQAAKDGPKKFWLGYSDEASLFLNGQLVFYGNSAYRSRDASFLGILGPFDAVSLPLRRGANEVLLIIGEASGGWGVFLQDATFIERAPGVEPLWTTGKDFLVPESAAYDPATGAIYVSNYDGYNPSRGARLQFLSKLTPEGRTAALRWVSGLDNPTGLAIRKNILYAVERTGIAEIDIPSAKIVRRTAVPGAAFLNDIAVAENGDVFVSDSRRGSVFRISGEKAEEWLTGPALGSPNGICLFEGRLVIGTNSDGCLKTADLGTREISTLVNLGQGIIDGIAPDGEGRLLVSHNEGRLFRVSPDGRVETVLDTTAVRMNMADFAYDPDRKVIVFPTFTESRVAAFRLGTK
jgi:sugar lactone lactonase YvrE